MRSSSTVGLLLASVFVLAGCAAGPLPSATPDEPTPTPTPTPTIEPAPEPAALVLSGSDIQLTATDGTVLAVASLEDLGGRAVLDVVTEALGETTAEVGESGCGTTTNWQWDGVTVHGWGVEPEPMSYDVFFFADSSAGLSLETTTGLRVGGDASELVAAGEAGLLGMDIVVWDEIGRTTDYDVPIGGYATVNGVVVEQLISSVTVGDLFC
jgi:hypothetical protein